MQILRPSAALLAATACIGVSPAQSTSNAPLAPPPNGVRSAEPSTHAFTGVTLHPKPGTTVENATIVIENGMIVRAGAGSGALPRDARVHDLAGMHVYASFIDPWVEVETPAPAEDAPGLHFSDKVTPHRSAMDGAGLPESAKKAHRGMGFGAAAIVPEGGIFAGMAAVVPLSTTPEDASAAHVESYAADVFHAMDFQIGGWGGGYPTSHPGCVALMRQTFSDAAWQNAHREGPANTLTPLERKDAPLFIDCARELEPFLAAEIAAEFGWEYVVIGSGSEYKWLDGIAALNVPLITPLRFPAEPSVATVGDIEAIELETLMSWEQAPAGPARLVDAGVTVAMTATMLPDGRDFHEELRSAIEHGLSERDALASLTTVPADLLGVAGELGTVERGKRASFIVASGPIFDAETKIHDVWIDGVRHKITPMHEHDMDGAWRLVVGDPADPAYEQRIEISGSTTGKPSIMNFENWDDEEEARSKARSKAHKVSISGNRLSFLIDDEDDRTGTYVMSGVMTSPDMMSGSAVAPDQSSFQWRAMPIEGDEAEEQTESADEASDETPTFADHPGYPFGPYAVKDAPRNKPVLFTNATVWTQGPDGIIENGYVLVTNGKIDAVGAMPESGGIPTNRRTTTIDLGGAHVSPGLIDAHSHTSLFGMGVNEGGQAVTAEVRIGDSLDPSSINWYRQLAHGVTTVLSLHGSANPIGGQSQITKVRWGSRTPRDMMMENARTGIKFALGENVKRSRGGREQTRYPSSRMGVETLMRDRFTAAREYADMIARPGRRANGSPPPRRDLELEAIAEILSGDRLVHCHSYRQDEILMLSRIAGEFGFTIGSFTHGLEVYKVPVAVKENALGASLFSDWWAYKVEVQDAIPFAGPLQSEAGVLTSFNSDSDELVR
ncbi:MAG: amidohydrolase family protein, partial [Planctomycetota bacterium]